MKKPPRKFLSAADGARCLGAVSLSVYAVSCCCIRWPLEFRQENQRESDEERNADSTEQHTTVQMFCRQKPHDCWSSPKTSKCSFADTHPPPLHDFCVEKCGDGSHCDKCVVELRFLHQHRSSTTDHQLRVQFYAFTPTKTQSDQPVWGASCVASGLRRVQMESTSLFSLVNLDREQHDWFL